MLVIISRILILASVFSARATSLGWLRCRSGFTAR